MATKEECRKALTERIKTRAHLDAFVRTFGGETISNPAWEHDEKQYVHENIRHIVDQADRKKLLDFLGGKLGISTDAEQRRLAGDAMRDLAKQSNDIAEKANARSHWALRIAIIAAIAAVVAAVLPLLKN